MTRRAAHAGAAAAALLLAGCAHIEPPPGGPTDSRRPYVAAVQPAPDSTGVGLDLDARILFSEWVGKDIERGQVYLSPPLSRPVRARLDGDELRVTSAARLDTGTTYVLGVLGTVKDLHGLPLEAPLELAFSTGAVLDSGKVEGTVMPLQGAPVPGAFAALYPRGADLRARFAHLAGGKMGGKSGGDSAAEPDARPDPAREQPAYIAPADSLGRFAFSHVRPGRYGLLGFHDLNGNLRPDPATEGLSVGPTVEAAAPPGPAQTLALAPHDTAPLRLVEARWVHETMRNGKSEGTVRLRFNRPPQPYQALRREAYGFRRAPATKGLEGTEGAKGMDGAEGANGVDGTEAGGAPPMVLDVCQNPVTGEYELAVPPLDPGSTYEAAALGLRDMAGNPIDTSHARTVFEADTAARDTAALRLTFLGPRKTTGELSRPDAEHLIPGAGMTAYYPRLMTDSLLGWLRARLSAKLDTAPLPFALQRRSHHEFQLKFPDIPLRGQRLVFTLAADTAKAATPDSAQGSPPPAPVADTGLGRAPLPTPDSGMAAQVRPPGQPPGSDTARTARAQTQAPQTAAAFTLADASKLGSLRFAQDRSAYGSRLVVRALAFPFEVSRLTPTADSVRVDSLPAGLYAVDYYRDANGDGLWNPGSLQPWSMAEPYAHWADSVEVKAGAVSRGGGKRPGAASKAATTPGAATAAIAAEAATEAAATTAAEGTAAAEAVEPTTAPAADSATTESLPAAPRRLAWPPEW